MKTITLAQLIKKYEANREAYLKPEYKEAQLRIDFLDPFFELLGWDIKNIQGKPTNEREVLVEETLREDALSTAEKPDYTFRLFSERKFYLEAKKPGVSIQTLDDPAKQLRRYGFTSKLKISILSNFEYLAIYDCSQKVKENDKASKSRIKLYHYTEYESSFETIKAELSHDSVYSGEFDKTWASIEERLKLFSVDDLFLSQINDWRLILGKEIFSHKPDIDEIELNDLVQRYINSIIFLRVCEDRNLETYKTLLASKDNNEKLLDLFRKADKKYNSGLFNHPFNEEIVGENSSAFWIIISQLYFPENTYSFSVFASDILGNIYEIFLSEKLQISDGSLSIEKKPENVDRDIVTTPTFIIKDILRKTVLQYCEGKSDKEILNSSFADIACGSGAFLLETYQLIVDHLIDFYLKHSPEVLIQTGIGTYKLPFEIKRKVLTNCIYGVDKDFNAVEACKFGLLLKLLENETNKTIPIPALPLLDDNIKFGNSLIDTGQDSRQDQLEINPFDFGDTKFDVIVGNPPYMSTEHIKQLLPLEMPIYKREYVSAFKQFDKYFLFIERGFSLLKDNGYLGYIVPSKFIKVGAGKKLRQLLKGNKSVEEIVSFGANQIFKGKTTYTCLLILKKEPSKKLKYLEIINLNDWKIRKIELNDYDSVEFCELDDEGWILVPGYLKSAYLAINKQSIPLEDLVGSENIYNGIQTSANDIYIHTAIKIEGDYVFFNKNGRTWQIEEALTRPYYQTSRENDDNFNSYRSFKPNSFVIYPYEKSDTGISLIQIDRLKREFPFLYDYLLAYKDVLNDPKRDIKPTPETNDEWYRYGRHQSLEKCIVPEKIIVGVLSQGNKYAIDKFGTLISSGGTAGYCMITLPTDCPYSIYYIQAILNSKYLEWHSSLIGEVFRGGYIARGTKVLKKLPIRVIDFSNEEEKAIHDLIANTQKELIELHSDIDSNHGNNRVIDPLQREFNKKKQDLDDTLKRLYGLGDSDKRIPIISDIYETN